MGGIVITVMSDDNHATDTRGLAQSSAREFGHSTEGFAVEFNFAGFACRSLTVETREEAEMIQRSIESKEGTTGVRMVVDS